MLEMWIGLSALIICPGVEEVGFLWIVFKLTPSTTTFSLVNDKILPTLPKDQVVVVNISGRGDKDLFNVTRYVKNKEFKKFLKEEIKRYEK